MTRFLCVLFVLTSLLPAQTTAPTATLQGIVADSSAAAVPGARVTARNTETRAERVTETGAAGQYTIRGLAPGEWLLQVEATGFTVARVASIRFSVGQVVTQNVTLQLAGAVERLEVNEKPEAIDTAASTAGVALGGERIEEAPARSRNYLALVLAAPAVATSANSSSQRTMTGTRSPLGDSGFVFGGMRARNNGILIDGMDNRDETTGANRVGVGLEMVQEFRVSAAAVGAELGGAAGGLLNMVTRSGVNIWHGDVTFFGQDGSMNAARPEVDAPRRPTFRRYQPGTSAMGPLRKDKTFIAAAFEHERERGEEWSNVPEWAVPATGAYRGYYPIRTVGSEFSTKLMNQFGTRDTLSLRYALSRGRVTGEVQGPDNFADRTAQGNSLTTDHSFVGEWMRVVSPTVLNSLRWQVSQRDMTLTPNGTGPMQEIPGIATFGQHWRLDATRTERHWQVADNFNFVLGRHHLSAGIDAHAVTLDADMRNGFAGVYIYRTLADYVARRPDLFWQSIGASATSMRTVPVGMWLQDRIELRPGLQAEIGLRFDGQAMPEGLPSSTNNAAPRVGLAWKPFASKPLVIRAGAGLFYDRYPLAWLNDAVQHKTAQFMSGGASGIATWRTASELPSTYSRKVTVGAEYGIDQDTTVTAEAMYLRGFHLPRTRNAAATLPPQYLLEQTARAEFTGVSVSVNRRMREDLAFLVAWNGGRTRDDGSDFDEQPLNPLDVRRDWALSRQHQAQRVSTSVVWEMFEGLTLSPMYTWGTGRPLNALLSYDAYRTGAYPLSARPWGFARNPFFTQGTSSLDCRLMKTFHVRPERAVLQFGIESFNLLNHTNPERVSQWYSDGQLKLSTYAGNIESQPARQVQFLVQYEF